MGPQWLLGNTTHRLFENFILGIFLLTKLGYGLFPKFTQDYGLFRPPQGRGRTLDCAWDFFCGRMIHRKLTSHPVQKQPFSSAGGKTKIDGDSFVQLVSKMAIFFHRR